MALGKAFIEVHADLTPFKQGLGKGIATMLKETQAAIDKAVKEGLEKAGGSSRGKTITPKIKPDVDLGDADRKTDGFFRGLNGKFRKSVSEFSGQLVEVLGSGATYNLLTAGLITAAVVASPLIAAAISGALTAGIGLAGIGAGIAIAFQDVRIKRSAKELGDFVMEGLSKAGAVFLEPVQRSIDFLKIAWQRFLPTLERGFASVAPYVDDLAFGVGEFVNALGPGLESAFGNAGPILQIVAEYLPVIGDALGYFFETLAANPGARAGLVGFFQILADTIIVTTDAISMLTSAFGAFILWLSRLPPAIVPDSWEKDIDEMVVAMLSTSGPAETTSLGLLKIGSSASNASGKANDLTASLNNFFGAQLAWVDANIAFEGSIDNVADAFKGANDSININTERGRTNVQTVNEAVKAAIRQRDAKIKETGSVAAGNAAYATSIERLKGVLRAGGLTEGQIIELIGAYDDIPPEVNTEINVPGLSGALSRAQMLRRELELIQHDRLSAQRNPTGSDQGSGGYADGGVVRHEQLAWVGEGNKPEAIIPLTNPGRAAAVMEEAGLLGMGGGTIVVQMILDGKVIDERIVRTNQSTARQLGQQPRALI